MHNQIMILRLCAGLDRRPGRERPAQATQGGGGRKDIAREDRRHYDRPAAARQADEKNLAPGDVVITPAVDLLSRDTTDLLIISREMQRAGAGIRSLAEPYLDTTSDFAEIVFAILGLAAKLERRRILERTARGRADAKAKGIKFGRKPILTPHQQQEARRRLEGGETQRSGARSYNVSQDPLAACPSGRPDLQRSVKYCSARPIRDGSEPSAACRRRGQPGFTACAPHRRRIEGAGAED
jgi:hypothetical protein